ncbi:unnamed protein product [Effrenium voratum]|uniref:Transmembrane protein n=1 Tax=Effrenium voratum TaxID=2562239 RepID=A0AA36IBC8_9DINO|nr:unnamed protein product [Effrenium voratum]
MQMVTCWALGAAAAFVLCLQDGLPLSWAFTARALEEEATCPLGLWILVFSTGAALLGLVASVYTPTCIRMRDICFLDVMSIHQTDAALKEKGIYGIGGFLSLSSELRVLWSPPYLTRLWCIFELAAFRKANPRGVIRLAPLFVEVSVLCMCLASSCASLLFWMVHTANPELLLYVVACSVVLSAMCCMLVHFLRRSMQGKQQLLSALQEFDLSQVGCRDEYDRDFIYRAIQQWYGSLEAFTDFVRHTLQEELAATLGSEQVVRVYSFLPCLPVLSVGLEYWLAFAKAGVSTTWQVSFIVGVLLSFAVFWSTLSFRVLLTLCSWLAAPRLWPLLDYLQSLLIFAAFAIFWCGGLFLATWAYAQSLWAMLGWASVSVLASASVMRK